MSAISLISKRPNKTYRYTCLKITRKKFHLNRTLNIENRKLKAPHKTRKKFHLNRTLNIENRKLKAPGNLHTVHRLYSKPTGMFAKKNRNEYFYPNPPLQNRKL